MSKQVTRLKRIINNIFKRLSFLDPYLDLIRIKKPTGIFLLFWPCVWGLCLGAYPGQPSYSDIGLFFLGSILMRSAGCCINDYFDQDFDKYVTRTANRPLAMKKLSTLDTIITLSILLSLSLLILLQFKRQVIYLGLFSTLFVVLYPLMKRWTYWPQLFLGFTYNWGILMGFVVYNSHLSELTLLVYISGIFWTLAYDTLYAIQDKKDDVKAGVKSLSLKLQDKTIKFSFFCYASQFILLTIAGYTLQFEWKFFLLAAIAWLWQTIQLRGVKETDIQTIEKIFKRHALTGFILSAAFLAA